MEKMRRLATYRISLNDLRFGNRKRAQEFLEKTGVSGSIKKKNGVCSLRAKAFRTKNRKTAKETMRKINGFPHLSVKIVKEHNSRRRTGGIIRR